MLADFNFKAGEFSLVNLFGYVKLSLMHFFGDSHFLLKQIPLLFVLPDFGLAVMFSLLFAFSLPLLIFH
jgi:hypothetical protein